MLKSYLWSTMSQEILNELAILCIEKAMLEQIYYKNIIDLFAFLKVLEEIIFI